MHWIKYWNNTKRQCKRWSRQQYRSKQGQGMGNKNYQHQQQKMFRKTPCNIKLECTATMVGFGHSHKHIDLQSNSSDEMRGTCGSEGDLTSRRVASIVQFDHFVTSIRDVEAWCMILQLRESFSTCAWFLGWWRKRCLRCRSTQSWRTSGVKATIVSQLVRSNKIEHPLCTHQQTQRTKKQKKRK